MLEKSITKCFTLYPPHIATIQQEAKDNGQSSDSAALRLILDEWAVLKAARQPAVAVKDVPITP